MMCFPLTLFSSSEATPITYKDAGAFNDAVNRTVYTIAGFDIVGGDTGKLGVASVLNFGSTLTPTGVTIGGVAATLVAEVVYNSTNDHGISLWQAVIGGSPTDEVVVTHASPASGGEVVQLVILSDVISTTALSFDTYDGGSVATSPKDTTVDTENGGFTYSIGSRRTFSYSGQQGGTITGDNGSFTEIAELAADGGWGGLTVAVREDAITDTAETILFTIPAVGSGKAFGHAITATWR